MNIAGVQPLSLLDYPGKPCSIIFTQGCVFRCSYCHNPELIPLDAAEMRDVSEVLSFLDSRKGIVDAVCITGGEPTLQRDLVDVISTLKQMGFYVKLDTNGIRPDVVDRLISASLVDYIAMDIKAPWHKYHAVINAGGEQTIDACKKTHAIIQESGVEHEFRTTILPGVHTRDDFFEMATYFMSLERYYIQQIRFQKTLVPIEQGEQLDSGTLAQELGQAFPSLIIASR